MDSKSHTETKTSCLVLAVLPLISPARLAIMMTAMKLLPYAWAIEVTCCNKNCCLCKLKTPCVVMLKMAMMHSAFSLRTPLLRPASVATSQGWSRASSFPDTSTSALGPPEIGESKALCLGKWESTKRTI